MEEVSKLFAKQDTALKACTALEHAIELYRKRYKTSDEWEQATYVASVVKHFELFYETFWKFLRAYLEEHYTTEILGSKDAFKAIHAKKLISDKQFYLLMDSVKTRNATVHSYDRDFAHNLCEEIVVQFPELKSILSLLISEPI